MGSYYKSSKPVVVHDDPYHYQRQPSADSSYSRSSTSSSAYHYSTMPNHTSTSSSSSSPKVSQTFRSGESSMFAQPMPYRRAPGH